MGTCTAQGTWTCPYGTSPTYSCPGTGGSQGLGGAGAGGMGGAAGTVGDGGGPVSCDLASNYAGYVQDPLCGIVGSWFAFGDGAGPNANANSTDSADSDCVAKGGFPASACSQNIWPTPGKPFVPDDPATSRMCADGIGALIQNKGGSPDYSDLWGAGIGLDFNNPGGDAGVKGDVDLSKYKGIAFDFMADTGAHSIGAGVPIGAMRVSFPFTGQHGGDPPYWMGATKTSSPLMPGSTVQHIQFNWTDVGGPFYLTQQTPPVTPPAFDPTHVQSIEFQVFTNTAASTPFSFCVANLTLLPN